MRGRRGKEREEGEGKLGGIRDGNGRGEEEEEGREKGEGERKG